MLRNFLAVFFGYGVIAVGGGYVSGLIARRREMLYAIIVGTIVEMIAIASMFAAPHGVSLWSQRSSILVTAPAAMLGGLIRLLQVRKAANVDLPGAISR